MSYKRTLFCIILCVFSFSQTLFSQCADTLSQVDITVSTDNWGYESSWRLEGIDGEVYGEISTYTYDNNADYDTTICVPINTCLIFTMMDDFGDGIFVPGGYSVSLDGNLIAEGGTNFTSTISHSFNCPTGSFCNDADTIGIGAYTATDNYWYVFIPDSTGTYIFSTCDQNDCDTKIWIYDSCSQTTNEEGNEGTYAFDDNFGGCGEQALVTTGLEVGVPYYIRIGDDMGSCGDLGVNWTLSFDGPFVGCTDPNSCNYNPLATVDDGSCIPFGDPDCPNAPDLLMRQDVLETSIYLTTLENNDECLIQEGCLQGYGTRDIIRFSTRIDNIGDADYYIGVPTADSDQFTYDNCHNHYHYDGYAEYVLYDEIGTEFPIGFKNGFCVLDLGCFGGNAQYSCGNMGISKDCYDEYWAELECQWIDVTDVPDGRYVFVTRVNWDNAPDFNGRVENDTLNNWAQVCVILDRTSGALTMELDDDCEPYVDCAGIPYGSSQPDCTGTCGGSVITGDLDNNGLQEMTDAYQYETVVLGMDLELTSCNDLNDDGFHTIYDAALLSSCINYGRTHNHPDTGPHDHCRFPEGVVNINDTVALSIGNADLANNYFDVYIENQTTDVVAYQFQIEGVQISAVENLVDPAIYPITPKFNLLDNTIVGHSFEDSTMAKVFEPIALVRIYFSEITDNEVCISSITDIINGDYEQTIPRIDGACLTLVNTKDLSAQINVLLQPNPFDQSARLTFNNYDNATYDLELSDVEGRVLRNYKEIRGNEVWIEKGDLIPGMYLYRLSSKEGYAVGKFVVK